MASKCLKCGKDNPAEQELCSDCSSQTNKSDTTSMLDNLNDTAITFDVSKSKKYVTKRLKESRRKTNTSIKSVNSSPVVIKISYDEKFFDRVVQNDEMHFPDDDNVYSIKTVQNEIFIGRKDDKRGINPELDVLKYTRDIAVSVRHAVVRVSANGDLTITDLGSTNGTYLGDELADAIEPHKTFDLMSGEPIFLGAWTKIVFETE